MKIIEISNKYILYKVKEKVIKITYKEWYEEAQENFYKKHKLNQYGFNELTKEQQKGIEKINKKYQIKEEREIIIFYLQWWTTINNEDYDEIKII